jgi:cyclic pyranopterin phosphate synthase
MPATVNSFLPQSKLLSFDAIERIVRVMVAAGVRKVRLTGGEPLMRPDLDHLVCRLNRIEGLHQIAMTTNGMMLAGMMDHLVSAGLTHINISLDTLREEAFRQISRRDGMDRVLEGIESALKTDLVVRLNALVLRDINLEDCIPLVEFARERNIFIRFIEFMPLDADRNWSQDQVVSGDELRARVESKFGLLTPLGRSDPAQPASDYGFADGRGGIGFIDPVSKPFCESCNRLRLTADGKLRNCLFGREEWDVRAAIDGGAIDASLYEIASDCIRNKFAAHGISTSSFKQPERAMYQIGG